MQTKKPEFKRRIVLQRRHPASVALKVAPKLALPQLWVGQHGSVCFNQPSVLHKSTVTHPQRSNISNLSTFFCFHSLKQLLSAHASSTTPSQQPSLAENLLAQQASS